MLHENRHDYARFRAEKREFDALFTKIVTISRLFVTEIVNQHESPNAPRISPNKKRAPEGARRKTIE